MRSRWRSASSRRKPARPRGDFLPLGELVQPGRKIVTAWALEGDFDPATLQSNMFEIEWPPKSGRRQSFPEVDRAQWFSPAEARAKILSGQREFIDRLLQALAMRHDTSAGADSAATADPPHRGEPPAERARLLDEQPRGDRAAPATCAALRSAIAGASRERQRASG